eukprot:1141715-Pelagomonas_calceolata.AAC.3
MDPWGQKRHPTWRQCQCSLSVTCILKHITFKSQTLVHLAPFPLRTVPPSTTSSPWYLTVKPLTKRIIIFAHRVIACLLVVIVGFAVFNLLLLVLVVCLVHKGSGAHVGQCLCAGKSLDGACASCHVGSSATKGPAALETSRWGAWNKAMAWPDPPQSKEI